MAGNSVWERFRYEKQPPKKFRTETGGSDSQSSEPPERNSFDCLLRTPDRLSAGLDSNISCIPETPTSMQSTPCKSPVFSAQGPPHQIVGNGQKSVADSTTKDGIGPDIKRGVKRRFRLMSESAESDNETTDSPSKTEGPSSPVFGIPRQLNGHASHKSSEVIDIPSDSDSGDNTTCDDRPSTLDMTPDTPSPSKRTARMGFSQSPAIAAQKKFRRIRQISHDESYEDSEEATQLGENKEKLVEDLQRRFPQRTREDLINTLVGLEWSLYDAITSLRAADADANSRLSESGSDDDDDDDDTSIASGSKSSGGWFSRSNPPKDTNGWFSNSTNDSNSYGSSTSSSHTCGNAKNRRRQRAVAIPEEYQNSSRSYSSDSVPSVKSSAKPGRRRIKQMDSSSDEEDVSPKRTKSKPEAVAISSDDSENQSLEEEAASSRTPAVDDDDEDYDAEESMAAAASTSFHDDEMPTFHKLVLSFFNEASIEELVSIDECSKGRAQKIVSMRPFPDFADLLERMEDTKGLGEHLVWNSRGIFQEREIVVFLMNKCSAIAERIQNIISSQMEYDGDEDSNGSGEVHDRITEEPSTLHPDHKLKPYQMIGLNWLALLHREGVSGILADEMGLGKTVQTIAFLAYLLEQGNNGPHVIVVPSSTLANWYREIMKWCPTLEVIQYSGNQEYRSEMRYEILGGNTPFDVIVTTYNTCISTIDDRALFRKVSFEYAIFDEGHMLKNMSSNRYQHLMKINAKRRLLLTGTPVQNNLAELISLLSFIMPDIFMNKASELRRIFGFQKLKSKGIQLEQSSFEEERIAHAKQIMQPFMLRRVKSEVLKQLPAKKAIVEHVDMTTDQQKRYEDLKASLRRDIKDTEDTGRKGIKTSSALMELRKMANHPLLIRHHFNDEKLKEMAHLMLKEPTHYDADPVLIQEDMAVMTDYELHRLCHEYSVLTPYRLDKEYILASGKFRQLDQMLPKLKEEGTRVLLFSQFVMVLDIVEPYMKHHGYKYLRLDGQTPVAERQELIDKFKNDTNLFIFLLSTKAGGLGINLTAANYVILHDIDYNPYNDKQAEDRCHRVGQTRDVTVMRLISKGTIEEAMLKCARHKLTLEERITTNKEEDEDDKGDVAFLLKQALEL